MNSVRFRRQNSLDGGDDYSSWKDVPMSEGGRDAEKNEGETASMRMTFSKKKGLKREFQVTLQPLSVFSVFALIGFSLLLVKYLDGRLPQPLTVKDLQNGTRKFIEERARENLIDLTSVGVRVSGSEATDKTTVENFLRILGEIKMSSTNGNLRLEYEVQRPSGAFYMDDDEGHTSVYSHIANVVAKLEPTDVNSKSNYSVLVNCHFDSKPGSPGATDNMISCVTMLEIIRVLTSTKSDSLPPITNTVVFLFNGAEELGLQGAHGFVRGVDDKGRGHPWAENLACFINLEGAGAGGREILFQTGPGNAWIMEAYANSVPHPYGLVLAEEAFQNGLIPSDTDFRIFRDFKNIPGLDMAFIKNGWIYHTKWDQVTEIPPGSIQNIGENALSLVEYLGDLNFDKIKIERKNEAFKMVFFDIFGLFMVAYSEATGIIVNYFIAASFIVVTILDYGTKGRLITLVKTLGLFLGSTVLAWGSGICVGVAVGAFFSGVGYYKPFYSYPFLSAVIFGLPAVLTQIIVLSFAWRGSQRKSWLAGKFTLAFVLMAISYVTRSAYVLTLILVFAIPVCLLRRFVFKKLKLPRVELISNLIIGELVPFLFASYLVITLVDVFVPIMGRSGPETNANIFLGVIIAAMSCILAFNGLSSYFVGCKKIHLIAGLVLSLFVLNPLIVFGFVGKIPFQSKTPMRVRVVDADRTWYNPDMTLAKIDNGYWFWPQDPNTMDYLPEFAQTVKEIDGFMEIDANANGCEDLYCNQLFLWPTSDSVKKTPWIPKQSPPSPLRDKVGLEIITNEEMSNGDRQVTLKIISPTEASVVVSPGNDYILTNWTLGVHVGKSGHLKYKSRPTYFIYIGKGYEAPPDFEFSLTLRNTTARESNNSSAVSELMNVMVVGHFMHDGEAWQDYFKEFISKFPSWTNVMSWSSVLKQYTIL